MRPVSPRSPALAVCALITAFCLPSSWANTLPVAAPDTVEAHAYGPVLVDLLANDGDGDGDALTVSMTGAPVRGSVIDHGDGTVTYTPDPVLFEGSGGDTFTYSLDDGRGGVDSGTVTVTEIPVPAESRPLSETVLLDEPFDSGLADWTFQDFGPNEGPSEWSILDGELRQRGNIWGDSAERGTYALYDGGTAWSDYRIRAKLRSNDDDRIGVVFRYQDSDNHYRFDWRKELSSRRLVKVEGGAVVVLAEDVAVYEPNGDFLLQISIEASQIEVSVDGQVVFSVQDTSFASGTLGFSSHGNFFSYFDDLRVTQLPQDSPVLLLEDRFDDGDAVGWLFADSGVNSFPSSWQVVSGELVQSSNIYGATFLGRSGTIAVLEAGHSWTNYWLRVKVRPTDNDDLAFYVRFHDWENHYAFHWNQQKVEQALHKRVDGQDVLLARLSEGYQYIGFYEHIVDFVVQGSKLEVRVDGHPVFSVQDDALRSGTVALGTAAMQSAHFDNVQVWAMP